MDAVGGVAVPVVEVDAAGREEVFERRVRVADLGADHALRALLRVWCLVLDRVPGLGATVFDHARLLEAILEGEAAAPAR
jgi:hypothetical protein